jgi:hypothetical protein
MSETTWKSAMHVQDWKRDREYSPLGDASEANEFLDVVSVDKVGLLPVTENGN